MSLTPSEMQMLADLVAGAAAKHTPKSATVLDDTRIALNLRECAEALGVSERSIWSMVKSGKLQSFKVGRSVRISRLAIESFISQGGSS